MDREITNQITEYSHNGHEYSATGMVGKEKNPCNILVEPFGETFLPQTAKFKNVGNKRNNVRSKCGKVAPNECTIVGLNYKSILYQRTLLLCTFVHAVSM